MKASILTAIAALAAVAPAANAAKWTGLNDASHCSGPKIAETDLSGKVVLVDCWGINCPPCRALLPRMEQLWKSFRNKPFMLVGNHCQGRDDERIRQLVRTNKLTYPIYQYFGLADGAPEFSGLPFLYVVDHRGRVVYSGSDEREATQAIVEALTKADLPPSLCGDVRLVKYKSLEKQLVWGRNCKSVAASLARDARRGQSKIARPDEVEKAREAEALLAAMEQTRLEARQEIAEMEESDPAGALKKIKELVATFPDDASEYRQKASELAKKAREQAAAKKAGAKKAAAQGR